VAAGIRSLDWDTVTTTKLTPQRFEAHRSIRTDRELRQALDTISDLLRSPAGGRDEDHLDLLSTLVAEYEREHHSIEPPTAIEAILFRIDQGGMTRADLATAVGGRSHASEILSGKRQLSREAMRTLNIRFGIPAESLLR
jgi:HTH-type transcriptional regulator/antitoxin HigA